MINKEFKSIKDVELRKAKMRSILLGKVKGLTLEHANGIVNNLNLDKQYTVKVVSNKQRLGSLLENQENIYSSEVELIYGEADTFDNIMVYAKTEIMISEVDYNDTNKLIIWMPSIA